MARLGRAIPRPDETVHRTTLLRACGTPAQPAAPGITRTRGSWDERHARHDDTVDIKTNVSATGVEGGCCPGR